MKKPAANNSDFIHPDDIVPHANGNVYIKNKCKRCNFKSAWPSEMIKHEKKAHNIDAKKAKRPIPNLIPIPIQTSVAKLPKMKVASETEMTQQDINDICAKSANSALKDFASLFGSEDVFDQTKIPDLLPTKTNNNEEFKQKNASFFDKLKEKLMTGTGGSVNLICDFCGYESKCLTEQAKHKKLCSGKELSQVHTMPSTFISSSRCQHCRQRCKSSTDLYNHLQNCPEALKLFKIDIKADREEESEDEELKIEEITQSDDEKSKPHPMENRVFVWNNIEAPLDIEMDDDSKFAEDKVDDNISLDLSIRTHSPLSENSYYTPTRHHSPSTATTTVTNEKIPTHGNDISIAQHKRVFKCPHCSFWASTASRFHVHIVGHLNKKPFECSLCAYRYVFFIEYDILNKMYLLFFTKVIALWFRYLLF